MSTSKLSYEIPYCLKKLKFKNFRGRKRQEISFKKKELTKTLQQMHLHFNITTLNSH